MSTEDLWNAALDRAFEARVRQVTNEKPRRCLDVAGDVRLTRARKYLATIPLPTIGHNSDRETFVAACRLVRDFAVDPSDAEELLWDWCGNRPGWDRKWIQQKVKSAGRHGKGQMGAQL